MQNSIKAKREERGITRAELAREMHVAWSTVWRWEEQQATIPHDVLLNISRILRVPPEELLPEFKDLAAAIAAALD